MTNAAPPPTEPHAGIFTVGLTGGIGSGKSTVADGFAALGIGVVDADLIAHALTGPGGAAMPAVVAAFGTAIQSSDGALDRAAMRQRAFSDAAARRQLEAILHPQIRAECRRQLNAVTSPYALLMVPLLVESGTWRTVCDRLLVVDCPSEIQIQRVMARNGLNRDEVGRIMAAQASRETRLAAATEIIDNSGSPDGLPERIAALHELYLRESAPPQRIS